MNFKMWVIGHTAIAYFLIKIYFFIQKKNINPSFFVFIFGFANLIDIVHFGPLRLYSHNFIGTFTISIFSLWLLERWKLIKKHVFSILLIIVGSHVLMDIIFSTYALFYPFDSNIFTIYGFNSFQDLFVESLSGIGFVILFIQTGDYTNFRTFIHNERHRFSRNYSLKLLFDLSFYPYYLNIGFILFTTSQLAFFMFIALNSSIAVIWYGFIFLMSFLIFWCVFISTLIHYTSSIT